LKCFFDGPVSKRMDTTPYKHTVLYLNTLVGKLPGQGPETEQYWATAKDLRIEKGKRPNPPGKVEIRIKL